MKLAGQKALVTGSSRGIGQGIALRYAEERAEVVITNNIPPGRLGKPADVAGAAVFLASADADYVTGATIFVDGGLTWNYSEQ